MLAIRDESGSRHKNEKIQMYSQTVAHDIIVCLRQVMAFSSMLLDRKTLVSANREKLYRKIRGAFKFTRTRLQDLSDLIKLESGQFQIMERHFNPK